MFERIISSISKAIVILALFAMIALSFTQIILRNFFDSGISWADVTVRHLVLWVGFFGAVIATVSGRHITLDIFSRVIPEGAKRYISAIVGLGSSVVCAVLAYASFKFVESERLMGSELFAGVPAWLAQAVIPVCFVLIAVVAASRIIPAKAGIPCVCLSERSEESSEAGF